MIAVKKNKNIIILAVLLLIWGASFLFSGKGEKKDEQIEKYEYKKNDTKNQDEANDISSWIRKRNGINFANKRDIFEKGGRSVQTQENEVKKESIEKEKASEVKEKREKEKNEKKKENKKQNIQQETQSQPQPQYSMDTFKVDEEQVITTEMYNIEIHGVFQSKNGKTVFLMYKGTSYEIIGEGSVKIYANNKTYEVKVYYYEDEYITFVEKSKNITIKKRVKE